MFLFFFFNDTATTEIYTLSLHDALPISRGARAVGQPRPARSRRRPLPARARRHEPERPRRHLAARQRFERGARRSEEHTSELQSRQYLVCRLLLEKKKTETSSPSTTCTF